MMRKIMQRRTMLSAAALAVFAIGGCATLGRVGFKEPIVSFKDLRVRGLGLTGGSIDAYLSVYNPNGFRLDATRLTYNVKVGVNPFAQVADLRAAREAFGGLSDALIAFVRSADGAFPDGVNAAYCPMARKSWLQRGSAIRNPYYGKAMGECGTIKN